ncbi:MAG TPA: glycosyltransferase family 39 protein, partial [Candidatus Rifleibacterium sp.]|nr:glycosyltransferase family 39 protein [Candidatus Rifleibacterium sp.]
MCEGVILSEPATVSPNNQSDTAVWQTRFFWLTGLLIVFRLFLSLYLDLTPDESYYWELSRRLDWSYFDHPPLVAWLIALFRLLPGESALEVRLISIFGSAFVGWCLFVIGKNHLKNPAAGFIAALMVNFTPAGAALGFVTTPDTPLAVAWAAGMLAFCRAINDEKPLWWVLTGVALGFGALGKYNMIM